MKALAIGLLCLLVFLVLLFVVPIRIICTVDSARRVDFRLAVQVLFVRIGILPRKKRLPNLRRFRRDSLEKLYARKEKKARKAALAKEKKAAKKVEKQRRAHKKGVSPKKRGFKHTIKLVIALTQALAGRFGRYLRVDIPYLDITAATTDPASTAILYGWVWAAMENLWNLLSPTKMFSRVKKNRIRIFADFCAEKPSVRGKIIFSVALWQVMALLIAGGSTALSVENEVRRKESAEQRQARAEREAAARAEMIRELKKRS